MKKFVTVLLAIMIMVVSLVPASAAMPPYFVGDVDISHDVSIIDATLIQRRVALLDTLEPLNERAADVDYDGEITIIDATLIQQYLSGIIHDFSEIGLDRYFFEVIKINDVHMSQNIDEIYVSDLVEFAVDYDVFSGIHKSDYYDCDYLIEYNGHHYYSVMGGEGAGYSDLICDFTYAGNYTFTVTIRNEFNDRDTYSFDFVVKDKTI